MAWVVALLGLALLAVIHEIAFRAGRRRWRRAGALAVGAGVHYLAVAAIGSLFFAIDGLPTGRSVTVVTGLVAGFDAETKLERGDRLLAVDGAQLGIEGPGPHIAETGGRAVTMTVERDGTNREIVVQPKQGDQGRWLLGVRVGHEQIVEHDVARALGAGCVLPAAAIGVLLGEIKTLLVGSEVAEPGGPRRIYDEYAVSVPWPQVAMRLLLRAAVGALLLQLLANVIRTRPSRS